MALAPVEASIDDLPRTSAQLDAAFLGEVVHAIAKDVVLAHDFLDVEAVVESLDAVRDRGARGFCRVLLPDGEQALREGLEPHGNVIGQRGRVEVLRGIEIAHLGAPAGEQRIVLANEGGAELLERFQERDSRRVSGIVRRWGRRTVVLPDVSLRRLDI